MGKSGNKQKVDNYSVNKFKNLLNYSLKDII